MGWTSGWWSRRELAEELARGESNPETGWSREVLRKCFKGNNLWTVEEVRGPDREPVRYVALYLLRRFGRNDWGYKDMTEHSGPVEENCPLSYLELAGEPEPATAGGRNYAAEWRERVRAYHARTGRKLRVGERVKLTNGWELKVTKLRPLLGYRTDRPGPTYRIPRRMLAAV